MSSHSKDLLHSALHPSSQSVSELAHPYSRPGTPHGHVTQIGFVGLGAMGYPIARKLATYRANHPAGGPALLVWNRTSDISEKLLKELGDNVIRVASSPEEIARECDVIITSLATDAVVRSVYEKFAAQLTASAPERNKIFVETSTIYPALAGELDNLISKYPHTHFITAPVFGTPVAAENSELVFALSGNYRSKKELAYLLVPAVGKKVFDLGGDVEKAAVFKLIGNSMVIGTMELLAESYTLGEKSGIGAKEVHNLMQELMPSSSFLEYGERMISDNFDGSKGFSIDGAIADASHIRRLTAAYNSPMPVLDVAHQHLITARALHNGEVRAGTASVDTLDWSAIIAGPRVAAGLDGLDSKKHYGVVRED